MTVQGRVESIELAPGLTASIVAHAIASGPEVVPCWTCVTAGLSRHGHRELVFTFRRDPVADEPFPADLYGYLSTIDELATSGRQIDVGAVTELGSDGLLGRAELTGITYVRARPLPGVSVSIRDDALAAIFLVDGEIDVLKKHGPSRILARLGHRAGVVPYPLWSELDREDVACGGPRAAPSVIDRLPRLMEAGVFVESREESVWIRVLASRRQPLAKALGRLALTAPVCLLVEIDPRAQACSVWIPGQQTTSNVSGGFVPEQSATAACFVAIVPDGEKDQVMIAEDGVALVLTRPTAQEVRRSLLLAESAVIEREGGRVKIHIETIPDESLIVPAEPVTEVPAPAGPVGIAEVVLLADEAEYARAVDAASFGEYIRALESKTVLAVLEQAAGRQVPRGKMLVQVDMTPRQAPTIGVAVRPQDHPVARGRIQKALAAVPAPPVNSSLAFQLDLWLGEPS